jgi:RNA recognition motif-containing protein
VTSAEVMMFPDGRSKGCGIVEYSDINAAARALTSLNGVELRGRPIYVREDRVIGNTSGGATSATATSGGATASGGGAHVNQVMPTALVGVAPVAPRAPVGGTEQVIYLETPRLYVNNLAWNVTWQDLKGLFRRVSIYVLYGFTITG